VIRLTGKQVSINKVLVYFTLVLVVLSGVPTSSFLPSLPRAEAANANLFVSAENTAFGNIFAGPQVVEVVIVDSAISNTTTSLTEPDVTVNTNKLRMVQAVDGNWYGYFASRAHAQTADQIYFSAGAAGVGMDFGMFCGSDTIAFGPSFSQTVGVAIPRTVGVTGATNGNAALTTCTGTPSGANLNHVVREPKAINMGGAGVSPGQIGLVPNAWPIIQLYNFAPTGNVVVTYNKGGGSQTTTLTFDSIPSSLISSTLDRFQYPQGAEIHATIRDGQLDIDPTDEDSWTWATGAGIPVAAFYQAFDENGNADANGGPGLVNIIPNLSSLMFTSNGVVVVDTGIDPDVSFLGTNNRQPTTSVSDGITTTFPIITFTQTGPTGGIFTNTDALGNSNFDTLPNAPRGQRALFTYNNGPTNTILIANGFGSLDINVPDGTWNENEAASVTLTDSDMNKNSMTDENLLVSKSSSNMPALKIGSPVTLLGASSVKFYTTSTDSLTGGTAIPSSASNNISQLLLLDTRPVASQNFEKISMSLGMDASILQSMLVNIADPNTSGKNLVNYDFRSIQEQLGVTDFSDTSISLYFGLADPTPVTLVNAGDLSGPQGVVRIPDAAVAAIAAESGSAFLVINFDSSANSVPQGVVSSETDMQQIALDLFSFGNKNGVLVNNAIYRPELGETGDNTAVFSGAAEYFQVPLNLVGDISSYSTLRTTGNIRFAILAPMTGENAARVSYLDRGADGINTQIADQQDAVGTPLSTLSVLSSTGTGTIQFSTSAGGFTTLGAIDESTLPTFGKPAISFPHGFISWTVTGLTPGQTIVITITYPSIIPAGAQYWKIIGGTWVDVTSLVGDNDGDNILTLTITDGGFGDADGTANGIISDPGGVAVTPGLVIIVPFANDDSYTTQFETATELDVVSNDARTMTIIDVSPTLNGGTTVITQSNTINYTPPPGFRGIDRFTYTVSNGHGDTATATVTVVILGTNGRIALVNYYTGNLEAYTINPDGTNLLRATSSLGLDVHDPTFSPDGTKIAYSKTGSDGHSDLYVINSDGSSNQRLTNTPQDEFKPRFSPDGSEILFTKREVGQVDRIFVMNSGGINVTPVTDTITHSWNADWSPDGTQIVFSRNAGGVYQIFKMNIDGTGLTQLTTSAENKYSSPRWSPDGTKILFDTDGSPGADIFAMNPDGTGVTNLTNSPIIERNARWSPDGTQIVFERSSVGGQIDLYTMNSDGSGAAPLALFSYDPDWGTMTNANMEMFRTIGPTTISYVKGIVFNRQESALYAVDFSDRISRLSTADGSVMSSVQMTLPGRTILYANGLALHPITGELYSILTLEGQTNRELVKVDPVTGQVTDIGNTGDKFAGIAFGSDGTLYGITGDGGTNPETLYTLSTVDASKTFFLTLGAGDSGETIAYNSDDGFLYHVSGRNAAVLERIDLDTKRITPIGIGLASFNKGEAYGITYWNAGNVFLWTYSDQTTFEHRLDMVSLSTPPRFPTSILSATGSGLVTFSTNAGTLESVVAVQESTLPTAGKPALPFPHGFYDWTVTGLTPSQTITMTMIFPQSVPAGAQYWKVIDGTWVDVTSLLGDNDGDNVLTLTITDGGLGDADGIANGNISDPGGVGFALVDSDGDGIPDIFDNCVLMPNHDQADWDRNGIGNVCDLPLLIGGTGGDSSADLYVISTSGSETPLSSTTSTLSSLAVAPDNTFYGAGLDGFFEVFPSTGATTQISDVSCTDLSFSPNGMTLYCVNKLGTVSLYTIDRTTGIRTLVGSTGISGSGNAMDVAPDGTIYFGNDVGLYTLSPTTGSATPVANWVLPPSIDDTDCRTNAFEFDPTGILYASLNCDFENYLVTVNTSTAQLTLIGTTVSHLDSLTFDRFLQNSPPVAQNDLYFTNEDTTLNVPAPGVLANDSDPENDPITAALVSGPSHGTLVLNADGSFTYTPDANYNGADSFTYRSNDGTADSGVATVNLTVNPVDNAPDAVDDSATTSTGTPVDIDVLANDSDPDGDTLAVSSATHGTYGSTTVNPDNTITYTPQAGFRGVDVFDYTISDGNSFDTAIVTITILDTNGKIAFRSQRDGNIEIYTMNTDGTGQTRLTNNAASDFDPSWSPDGTKIAFPSDRNGNLEIYTMNADGTGQTRLTNNPAFDSEPSWSPDGTKITFRSGRDDGTGEIYTMNADGTGVTRLTNDPAVDTEPSWSPDGTKIAFASNRNGNLEVYTMNADGTGVIRLTNNDAIDNFQSWSPDGTKIAFTSNRNGNSEVYVMNSDGTGQINLSNNAAVDGNPTWSPDGTKIVFNSNRNGNFEIYTMSVDGTGVTRLTDNGAEDALPDWGTSPDTPSTTADSDGDGIPNVLDSDPASASTEFSDVNTGGTTFGNVLDNGGLTLSITDLPNPKGVLISATGAGTAAQIEACSDPTSSFSLSSGDSLEITCSSSIITVISGPVTITYTAPDGTTATTTLATGSTLTISSGTTFTVDASESVADVTITINGQSTTIPAGETQSFPTHPKNAAFTDGVGVTNIATCPTETTIATLTPSLAPGDNLVVAATQFVSSDTGAESVTAKLYSDGVLLVQNEIPITVEASGTHNAYTLLSKHVGYVTSNVYTVKACTNIGAVNGEAKIVAIAGMANSAFADGTSTYR